MSENCLKMNVYRCILTEKSLASSERIDLWRKGRKNIIKSNTSSDI